MKDVNIANIANIELNIKNIALNIKNIENIVPNNCETKYAGLASANTEANICIFLATNKL